MGGPEGARRGSGPLGVIPGRWRGPLRSFHGVTRLQLGSCKSHLHFTRDSELLLFTYMTVFFACELTTALVPQRE